MHIVYHIIDKPIKGILWFAHKDAFLWGDLSGDILMVLTAVIFNILLILLIFPKFVQAVAVRQA